MDVLKFNSKSVFNLDVIDIHRVILVYSLYVVQHVSYYTDPPEPYIGCLV